MSNLKEKIKKEMIDLINNAPKIKIQRDKLLEVLKEAQKVLEDRVLDTHEIHGVIKQALLENQ